MLTTKEAAKKAFVEDYSIRQYIRVGLGKPKERLKAIKIRNGGRPEWRIKQSDLEYYRKKYLS